MGFLDWLFRQAKPQTPIVPSILPAIAKDEITNGRLPHINVDELFTKPGEICHYADRAVLAIEKAKKDEAIETEHYKGMLYITNRRIIFSSKTMGFDKQYRYLSSIKPYSNAVELQYGSTIYSIFVPDGFLVYTVVQMLK